MLKQEFTDFHKWSTAATDSDYTIETSETDANRRLAFTKGANRQEMGHYSTNLNHGEITVEDAEKLNGSNEAKESTVASKQPPPQVGRTDTQAIQRAKDDPSKEVKSDQPDASPLQQKKVEQAKADQKQQGARR